MIQANYFIVNLTLRLKVGEGSAVFGLCARLWRKPTEPLPIANVQINDASYSVLNAQFLEIQKNH